MMATVTIVSVSTLVRHGIWDTLTTIRPGYLDIGFRQRFSQADTNSQSQIKKNVEDEVGAMYGGSGKDNKIALRDLGEAKYKI
ncbi:hypothetical protein L1887_38678 [Cichorium endivia]|nr:hypothetical protein L1887_38678 [Cichorium endivia]